MGLALARIVLASGHNLIATSRNPSRTPDLVAEIEKKGGKWLALDVNDQNSADVITSVEKESGVDVLVNNAGYCIHAPAEVFREEEVKELTETLYFGPFRLMRAALPGMRARRFGVVVNFSSGAAIEGRDSMGVYAGAKAALDGMFFLGQFSSVVAVGNNSKSRPLARGCQRGSPLQHPLLNHPAGQLRHQHGQHHGARHKPAAGGLQRLGVGADDADLLNRGVQVRR